MLRVEYCKDLKRPEWEELPVSSWLQVSAIRYGAKETVRADARSCFAPDGTAKTTRFSVDFVYGGIRLRLYKNVGKQLKDISRRSRFQHWNAMVSQAKKSWRSYV